MLHDRKMKDSIKSSGVSMAPVANFSQANILLAHGRPSRVGVKSNFSRLRAPQPKNHLAWYVPLNSKPLEEKISRVTQIKWKCPPKFALNAGWHVAAGEGSQEADTQKYRETTVREVVYPDRTAIPPSPCTSPHVEGECSDDSQTIIIPIIPTEEVAGKMPFDTSATVNANIRTQAPASHKVPSVSGNLPLSQCNPSGSQDQPVHDKSLHDMLRGLENVDVEVAVAAVATVAAVMENREQIDTELLVKLLTDPEMVKKLIDGNRSTAKPENETPPSAEPNTSIPFSSSTPASLVNKAANECSEPLSGAISSNFTPQAVNQSLVDKSASKLSDIHAGSRPIHTSKPAKISSPSPRSNSYVPPMKNLTGEPGGPAQSHIHQIAAMKQVRPLMPSRLRPDEEMIMRLVNKYTPLDIAGIIPVAPHNQMPPSSRPDEYTPPDVAGIIPVAPHYQMPPSSRPDEYTPPDVAGIILMPPSSRPDEYTPPDVAGIIHVAPHNQMPPSSRPDEYTPPDVAGVIPVAPLNQMPSTSRSDEEMIKRLVNKYTPPNISGIIPVASHNPSTSKPNVVAIKKMIHAYGAPDAAGIKPVAPLIAPGSRPPNMEEPYVPQSPLLLAPTHFHPVTNMHALANASVSNFAAAGNFRLRCYSPLTTPAPKGDLNYHKSQIEQHGEKHETMLPKIGQPGNYLQGLESAHNIRTPILMNSKCQKPCIYFNSPKGCRNGYNCRYQHDVSKWWRAVVEVEVPVAKRMKFNEQMGKL